MAIDRSKPVKSNKRPTGEMIRLMLNDGHFGSQPDDLPLPIVDPITVTQLVLTLNEIKPYDKNPRQLINPAYASIKASILSQRGLNNPFTVTRRPGDEHYMVRAGGNTRLAILQELYAETGDAAFNVVSCLFIPWTNESAVITAHLIENELRGEMALIDKAHAVATLRTQFEQEQGSLSDRAFIRELTALGYSLSARQLARLSYVRWLAPIIPQALSGLSSRQLDALKSIEKAYRHFTAGTVVEMSVIFVRILAEHDAAIFSLTAVRAAIDDELSELLAIPLNQLVTQMDAWLSADDLKDAAAIEVIPTEAQVVTSSLQDVALLLLPSNVDQAQPVVQQALLSTDTQYTADPVILDSPLIRETQRSDVLPYYQRGYVLALQVAQHVDLADVVLRSTDGVGFLVQNATINWPNQAAECLWWLLWELSQSRSAADGEQPHTPISKQQIGVDNVPQPSLLLCQVIINPKVLSDAAFNDIVELMQHCRQFCAKQDALVSLNKQVEKSGTLLHNNSALNVITPL